MAGEVVPFGKYKGQPVEALAQDRQYVDWLTAQPWFRDRFANIYALIVNNFQEPADTPEHNKLQTLFLDAGFRERFFRFLCVDFEKLLPEVDFEFEGFDVHFGAQMPLRDGWASREFYYVEIKPTVGDDYPAVLRQIKEARDRPHLHYGGSQVIRREAYRQVALFLTEYVGTGATVEQFIAIFEGAGIKVVFQDEI